MGTSPENAFGEFVVQQALESMTNQTKIALADCIRAQKGCIQMDKKNVGRALEIFLHNNPGFQDQIEITSDLLRSITSQLTDAILNEGSVFGTATAVGRKSALFTSGNAMQYC